MRIGKERGSYMPVLSSLVHRTVGPILELGAGYCSTPYLHWMCYPTKRRLVTFESNPEYYKFAKSWEDDFHEIRLISDWDSADLSERWDISFVDHGPNERRIEEVKRLTHSNWVVLHDSERGNEHKYHYRTVQDLYKWRWQYKGAFPYTSVWSNRNNLRHFSLDPHEHPIPLTSDGIVSETYMNEVANFTGVNRPYTICIALGRLFVKTTDIEDKLLLRYATTLAKCAMTKLREYNPIWLKEFYPRFIDYDRLMRK